MKWLILKTAAAIASIAMKSDINLSFLKDIDFNDPNIKKILDKFAEDIKKEKLKPITGGVKTSGEFACNFDEISELLGYNK